MLYILFYFMTLVLCFGGDNSGSKIADLHRTFILEGSLSKRCRNKDKRYQFFLFNDMLTYASSGLRGKYNVHQSIPLTVVRIENLEDTQDLANAFQV